MKKKPLFDAKIPGDTEDSIVICKEINVYPMYHILSSNITVEYKQDSEEQKPDIKVQKRRYQKKCKTVNVKKTVKGHQTKK